MGGGGVCITTKAEKCGIMSEKVHAVFNRRKGLSFEICCRPVGENDTAAKYHVKGTGVAWKRGVNVTQGQYLTAWEEERCYRDGKNVSVGIFCHNPGKKGLSFCPVCPGLWKA